MNSDEVESIVRSLISKHYDGGDLHEVPGNRSLMDDLGLDSLRMVDLFLDVEDAFKIELDGSLIPSIGTIDDLCLAINHRL